MYILVSLDKRFALNQVVELFDARLSGFALIDRFLDYFVQLGSIEELTRVGQDVVRSIIQHLEDKQLHHCVQLWMLPKVLLIFNSQFQLHFHSAYEIIQNLPSSFRFHFSVRG